MTLWHKVGAALSRFVYMVVFMDTKSKHTLSSYVYELFLDAQWDDYHTELARVNRIDRIFGADHCWDSWITWRQNQSV